MVRFISLSLGDYVYACDREGAYACVCVCRDCTVVCE